MSDAVGVPLDATRILIATQEAIRDTAVIVGRVAAQQERTDAEVIRSRDRIHNMADVLGRIEERQHHLQRSVDALAEYLRESGNGR